MAAYIISLDITIVNVAALVRQLGAATTGLQWVVDAYHLALAASLLVAGSLPDRLGRKGCCSRTWGCSVPPAWPDRPAGQLIALRAVMTLGAAMMSPSTLSLPTNVFTGRRERAIAIGL